MPREYAPRRSHVGFRLSPAAVALIAERAAAAGVTPSDWYRAAVGAALAEPQRVSRYLPKR
jgi:hypothetical protein